MIQCLVSFAIRPQTRSHHHHHLLMHHSSIHPSSYMPHGFYNPSMNTKSSSSTHASSIHHASLALHPSTPLVGFWCVRYCSTPAPCFLPTASSLSLSLSLLPPRLLLHHHLGSVIAECTVVACFWLFFPFFLGGFLCFLQREFVENLFVQCY